MWLKMRRDVPDYRPFGGSSVGQHGTVFHRRNNVCRQRTKSAHRHCHDHKVGIRHRGNGIIGEAVDKAQTFNLSHHLRVGIAADNMTNNASTAGRQRNRGADQTDADDGNFSVNVNQGDV